MQFATVSSSRWVELVLCACLVMGPAGRALSDDWPTWRGSGDGIATGDFATSWSAQESVHWKISLAGPGNSSPIVVGNRVFVTQYVPESQQRKLLCFSTENGDVLWEAAHVSTDDEPTHPTNPLCAASPTSDGEYVVAYFGSAGLCCYDLEGKLRWNKKTGSPQHLFGQGASPLIHGNMVTMNCGPGSEQFWVTLDLETGDELWRLEIPKVNAPNPFDQPDGPKLPEGTELRDPFGSWATAAVLPTQDAYQLLLAFPQQLRCVEADSGKTVWTCGTLGDQVFATPLIFDDAVICLGATALAVQPGGQGDVTESHRVWFKEKDRGRIGTGVVTENAVIVNTMRGIIDSIDPKTGKENWRERLSSGGQAAASWSSLCRAGEYIYAPSKSGTTFVFKANPAFELISTNSLGETMNSSLAFADGCIYIRTDKHLWCLRKS